jgi:hypothetical protein
VVDEVFKAKLNMEMNRRCVIFYGAPTSIVSFSKDYQSFFSPKIAFQQFVKIASLNLKT